MAERESDVSRLLVRELEAFKRELDLFPDDESLWRTVPGISNSAGNLVLHVAGNLQYFVGSVLGGSGYVRSRESEFGTHSGTKRTLLSQIDAAIRAVQDVFPRLSPDQLERDFPEPVGGSQIRTSLFLLHLATHTAYHLGQAGYLRRAATGDSRTSAALPVKILGALADR